MRKLILALMLSVLLLGFGTSQAATSAFDNLPGGAGVFMWQASATGDYTLVNVQNVADVPETFNGITSTAVVIHISLYDRDSNNLFDWSCPLSQRDNYGFAITNSGGLEQIAITSDGTPYYIGSVGGIGNCTSNYAGIAVAHNPAIGLAGALQYGYGTVAITRTDALLPANLWRQAYVPALLPPVSVNGNGDARDDVTMANTTVALPDLIFIRTAFLGTGYAFALNGNMLQGFLNCSMLQAENVASAAATTLLGCGWVGIRGTDTLCTTASTVDWDNSATFQPGTVALLDFNEIDIQAPELYITNNRGTVNIAMESAGGATCARGDRRNALGSADGIYWGRYNVTPGFTDTTLISIAPASSATVLNPARAIADTRNLTVSAYDDKEIPVSTTIILPPEVGMSPFLSATNAPRPGNASIGHGAITAGEARIASTSIYLPLYGYVYTTVSGVEADMYPLVKNRQAVNVLDLATFGMIADGVGINNIEYVGF